MNIRPKNTILFALTGVKFSLNNLRGANWRQQVFNNYRLHLLDLLTKYGEADDYGSWLNEMLSRHSKLYNLAGGENGNWEDTAYKNDLVGLYQQDYRGGLGNDNLYKRYGSVLLSNDDKYDFNLTGIKTNQSTRYNIANPPSRTSGDYSRDGYNYKIDNLYSAITDDRRLLGRKGDWDENSEDFKSWQKDLNSKGWETYLDTNDNYYKLRRLPQQVTSQQTPLEQGGSGINPNEKIDKNSDFWKKLSAGFNKVAPDLLAAVRYAGNMHNNERVYNEMKLAIIPNLLGTYTTHRQIVGDEATKQAYYRRAAQGESKAAKPFTSDADRQMAYMMEAKRIGDELKAQGDLADNQEIRRTSDESNQHQWANALRANEVANANITELNKAKAARHQLAAQKYTADWTNTDLYLMGWESKFKLKLAEEKELERQLALLDTKENLLGDNKLTEYKDAASLAYDEYYTEKDPTKKATLKIKYEDALKKYLLYNILKTREGLKRLYGIYTAKTGTKITKKDNSDKFLYKTSRDIVEHFRRMSKMTDDSRIRTMPKPVKLSSHPRKMLLGGVAPFTIYRPLGAAGGETTTLTATSTDSKSSKDTAAKDKLDMIKELFQQVQGLPVDVSLVYLRMVGVFNKARAFGEEMSSDDIAAMYLSSMNEIAKLKYSLKAYEDARNVAVANDAMNEIAVGANGEIALYDSENLKVKRGSLKQLLDSDGKLMALTNGQLLTMRAHSPNLAFDDQVFDIVNNGVGMSKIATHIKSIAGTIGSMETKIEGISEVESRKIKNGLQILAGTEGTPNGFYKVTNDKKESSANVKAALNYIYNILPKNYRTILELNSNGNGLELIYNMLASQVNDFVKQDITPLTGKAANKDGKDSGEKVTATFNDLIQRQQVGIPREFSMITKGENTKLYSFDAKYVPTLNKVNSDMSILNMLAASEIGNILDSRLGITFGDQIINPDNLKDIMFSVGGGATFVTLPCKYENGHKVVNFAIKDDFDEAIKEASKTTPIDWTNQKFTLNLANILKKKGLDSLLTGSMELDPNMLGLFMVVEGYATDRVKFNKNSKYIEKISNPDKELENRLNNALSIKGADGKVQNYGVDINDWGMGPLFEGNWDDIYHGSVFIPLNNDPVSALIGQSNLNREEARLLASEYQNYQKLIKANKNNLLYEVE